MYPFSISYEYEYNFFFYERVCMVLRFSHLISRCMLFICSPFVTVFFYLSHNSVSFWHLLFKIYCETNGALYFLFLLLLIRVWVSVRRSNQRKSLWKTVASTNVAWEETMVVDISSTIFYRIARCSTIYQWCYFSVISGSCNDGYKKNKSNVNDWWFYGWQPRQAC